MAGRETAGQVPEWGAHSAVSPLRRVMVRPPRWSQVAAARERHGTWGYMRTPDLRRAQAEHAVFVRLLEKAGVDVVECREHHEALFDSVFACDWGVVTRAGAIVFNLGKAVRRPEADMAERALSSAGVPILHRMSGPATAEGGDLLWLAPDLLLVGRSYRTNAPGIEELRGVLEPLGVRVVSTPVAHWKGPGSVMHLLSCISVLDADLAVAYLPPLAVETVEFLRARGIEIVEVSESEFNNLACNVLAVGPRRCVAVAGNLAVRRELERRGVEVMEYPAWELGRNMGGGPTCLVQALLRE